MNQKFPDKVDKLSAELEQVETKLQKDKELATKFSVALDYLGTLEEYKSLENMFSELKA